MRTSFRSRRNFLVTTALTFAGGAASAQSMHGMGNITGMAGMGGSQSGTTRWPLDIPPTYAPFGHTLTAAATSADLGGRTSRVLAYDGYFPGPTFRAWRGDTVDITLANALPVETNVHWHGLIAPTDADGQPQDPVPAGAARRYRFPIVQRAGLNWYHPHLHGFTGEQVALGLAGAFVVTDGEEAALGLPSGAYEIPLIARDASYDSAGNLVYNPTSSGFMGKTPLVNGTRDPRLDVDRAVYRLRVLNGATARVMQLALGSGTFTLIGNDGGLLPSATPLTAADISPGERLDLLLDLRGVAPSTKVMLRDNYTGWNLLELNVIGPRIENAPALGASLSVIETLANPVTTRTFAFDGMTRINGRVFEPGRIDFEVPLGATERWVFSTGGNAPHPVHVHGASFQVVGRRGGRGRVFAWERGWKDTVLLQNKETVEVLVRFDGYRGRYLIHCHKLEHEDQGMMANFLVV